MATNNFAACLPVILANEGGKANNPADPGGKTDHGITQRTYDAYRRGKGEATEDVYDITSAEVSDIYQKSYWTAAGCETLAAGLDLSNFDGTVNSGLGNSRRWLAKAKTQTDTSASIHAYSAARLTSVEQFKAWVTFGKGWSARIASVEAKSLAMALGSAAPVVIAKAGAKAATKAKVTGAASVASATFGAAVTVSTVQAHPLLAGGVALVSFLSWLASSFHASTSSARAATLGSHAVTLKATV